MLPWCRNLDEAIYIHDTAAANLPAPGKLGRFGCFGPAPAGNKSRWIKMVGVGIGQLRALEDVAGGSGLSSTGRRAMAR
jgi:hypothetical protein